MFPDLRQKVHDLFPARLNGFVRGRQLAFGRKKRDQPAEQKGHTADYHRNANRIHFECSEGHRRAVPKGRKGDTSLKISGATLRVFSCWRFGVPNPITCPRPSIRILGSLQLVPSETRWPRIRSAGNARSPFSL